MHNRELTTRFGLRDGQITDHERGCKNLHWKLNGVEFGFGDLSREDLDRIHSELSPHEVFTGWNEHHGTDWQQTDLPMVTINVREISFPHFEDQAKRFKKKSDTDPC